jgi:hypothetical protein
LPEQEIAHPQLSTGANQQIGIGILVGVKVLRDDLLRNFRRFKFAGFHLGRDGANAFDYLLSPAIAERENQCQPVMFRQRGLRLLQLLLHKFGQTVNLADDFQPHIVARQFPDLIF